SVDPDGVLQQINTFKAGDKKIIFQNVALHRIHNKQGRQALLKCKLDCGVELTKQDEESVVKDVRGNSSNMEDVANLLPPAIQLRLIDNPDAIIILLSNHPNTFKYATAKSIDIQHLNSVLKAEHWYQIVDLGLLPVKAIASKKEVVFKYMTDNKGKVNAEDANVENFFKEQRGLLKTSQGRGMYGKFFSEFKKNTESTELQHTSQPPSKE
ncbi:MAG: hypothetical protein ACHP6H_07035, partial [Legionellales bacterium]